MFNTRRAATPQLLDKYYTKSAVAQQCLGRIKGELAESDLIIEPAAGSGVFLAPLAEKNTVALDLVPEGPNIRRGNWFDYRVPAKYKNVAVVGNPPFGVNNNLSKSFIQHALCFSNVKTIAFILPTVYKKHTRQRILPAHWRIQEIYDLPDYSFTYHGEARHVPCAFFVFSQSPGPDLRFDPRQYQEAVDFWWGDKNNYDFFMFGAAPKKLVTQVAANNRGYYVLAKIEKEKLRQRILSLDWTGNSSAAGGVYWLTKPEIVFQYNQKYAKPGN